MTDKRFKMGESDIQGEMMFTDTQTNKIYWQEYFDEIIDLLNELTEENKQLRKQVESSETTSNATSHYNAFLESKITTLEKENEELKQKLENIGLNEKNDTVKMLEGKFFIRK